MWLETDEGLRSGSTSAWRVGSSSTLEDLRAGIASRSSSMTGVDWCSGTSVALGRAILNPDSLSRGPGRRRGRARRVPPPDRHWSRSAQGAAPATSTPSPEWATCSPTRSCGRRGYLPSASCRISRPRRGLRPRLRREVRAAVRSAIRKGGARARAASSSRGGARGPALAMARCSLGTRLAAERRTGVLSVSCDPRGSGERVDPALEAAALAGHQSGSRKCSSAARSPGRRR